MSFPKARFFCSGGRHVTHLDIATFEQSESAFVAKITAAGWAKDLV